MFVLVPIVLLITSVSTIYLFTYCKTRNLKSLETQVNDVTNSRRPGARRSAPSIYVIPTTNQVMQMYIQRAVQNASTERSGTEVREELKPPPDYGQIVVEIPPTYEEAIGRENRNEH